MTVICRTLPFPRGSVMSDGIGTPADGDFAHLTGRLFAVPDELHKGGEDVILRCVQNDSGSALTLERKCVSFSTGGVTEFGSKIDGVAGTGGEVCKPMDDYYRGRRTSCPANDLMYVVDEGRVDIMTTADCTLEVGFVPIQMIGFGTIDQAIDKDVVIGTAMEAAADTAVTTAVCVFVDAGLKQIGTSV